MLFWTKKLQQTMETFKNHIMRFMTSHMVLDHVKIEYLLNHRSYPYHINHQEQSIEAFKKFAWKALLKEKETKEDQRNGGAIIS